MSRRTPHHRPARARWLPLAAIAALFALGFVAWMAWPTASKPALAVDPMAPGRLVAREAVIDLGRVPFDRVAEARFELQNTGGSPVALTQRPRVRMLEGC